MSDTYEFLSLSDTEEMAEPSEGTMALVLDGGAVKRVPASQFGGGGVGSYIVNVTNTGGASWTADKTYSEITAAMEGGAVPVVLVDLSAVYGATMKFYIPLIYQTEDSGITTLAFMQVLSAEEVNAVGISSDGSIMVELSSLAGA